MVATHGLVFFFSVTTVLLCYSMKRLRIYPLSAVPETFRWTAVHIIYSGNIIEENVWVPHTFLGLI
jgi:hypothetical protein